MSSTVFYEVVILIMHIKFPSILPQHELMMDNDNADNKTSNWNQFNWHHREVVYRLRGGCEMKGISSSTSYTLTHIIDIITACENHIMKGMSIPHIHTHITHFHHSTLNLFPTKRHSSCNYNLHTTRPLTVSCSDWNGEQIAPNLCVDLRSISE